VLYEQEDFEGAYRLYRSIDAPETTLADVILEEAWAKYRQQDFRKAMGLLVAFSAPSFQNLFKPEQYILKALIYMQFCHYEAARSAMKAFEARYGTTLARVRNREDLLQDPEAARILEDAPAIRLADARLRDLEAEEARLKKLALPEPLAKELERMYALERARTERKRERQVEREIENVKKALFDAEEQIHLLQYEAGMSRYERVRRLYYEEEAPEADRPGRVPALSANTYYRFQGEFWTDELDDYNFFIEDHCRSSKGGPLD
jgi:hypothetical protein